MTESGPFLNTIQRCVCVCVRLVVAQAAVLFIIDFCEAGGKGSQALWDRTTMIMSDLQLSAFLLMTVQDFHTHMSLQLLSTTPLFSPLLHFFKI